MANRRSRADAAELDRSESARSLRSVAEDFAALAEIFERQLDVAPESENQIRQHLLRAKAAAERGVQLSRELLRQVESRVVGKTA